MSAESCLECGGRGTLVVQLSSGDLTRVECWVCMGTGKEASA